MWRSISVGLEKYLIQHVRKRDNHVVHVTNLVNIWSEDLSSSTIILRCAKDNPAVEAEEESLIEHIFSLINDNRDDVSFNSDATQDNTLRTLEVKSELVGVPFRFTFKLELRDAEIMYAEVTLPLLLLSRELLSCQNTLCALLEAKDAEIAEYKLEGVRLKRKKMETEVFDRAGYVNVCVAPPPPANVFKQPVEICSEELCTSCSLVYSNFKDIQQQQVCRELPDEVRQPVPSPPLQRGVECSVLQEEPDSQVATQQDIPNIPKKRKLMSKPKLRL